MNKCLCPRRLVGLSCALVIFSLGPATISADSAQYFYDALGRLVEVVDGQGNTAIYNYDQVGNLLGITRGTLSPPTNVSVTPTIVDAGTTTAITITGSGLIGSRVTTGNPEIQVPFPTSTDTRVQTSLIVPNPTTFGPTTLTLTAPGGVVSTAMTIRQPAPSLTQLNPNSGLPGTVVTINGSGFGTKSGSNSVTFTGSSGNAVPATILSWSFSKLTVVAPPGIAAVGAVAVTVGGLTSNAAPFSLTGIQRIAASSLQGTPAQPGAASANPGQTIQLVGAGFTPTSTVSGPVINAAGVLGLLSVPLSNVSADGTTANINVPNGAVTGLWSLNGSPISGVLLQIVPTLVAYTSQPLVPGGALNLIGSGFRPGQSVVVFPGAVGSIPGTVSNAASGLNNQLSTTIPSGLTSGPLRIQTDGGSSNVLQIPKLFSLSATAATGIPLVPGTASSNAGQTIQLQGASLSSNTMAIIPITNESGVAGTAQVTVFNVSLDGSTATIAVPSQASSGTVQVNGIGAVSLQVVPTVSSATLTPGTPFGPGAVLTISGSGFKEGATTVSFSGATAPVPASDVFNGVQQNDRLTVTIPPGANGASFAVTTDGGTSATRQFGVLQSITALAPRGTPQNPAQPSANVGQTITLQGAGFGAGSQAIFTSTSDTGVSGLVAAPLINVNPTGTVANVIVPATATSGPVNVDGQGNVSLQIVPTVFTLTLPDGQTFASGIVATLGGTGFKEGATTVTFSGASPVAATDVSNVNSRLTVTIPPGAVEGTILVTADENIGVFDTTRPSVKLVLPFNGQTNVPLNTRMAVLFDEPVQPATVTTASLFVTGPNGLVAGTVTLSTDKQTAIFAPTQPLEATNGYAVSFTTGITDIAGNALNPGATTFSTGTLSDATAPTVTNTSPQSGTSAVPTNAVIRLYFSESLLNTTVTSQSVTLSVGGTPVPVSMVLEQNNTVLRLQPSAPLQANVTYTVTMSPTVADLAGNSLAAQFTSTFSAGTGADTISPTVSTRSPQDGANNVPSDTTIVVTFSEPIEPATVNATTTFTLTGGGISGTIPGMFSLTPDRLRVTFTPLFPLFAGQTFFLTLNGIEDSSGNRLAQTTSSFSVQAGTGGGTIPVSAAITSAPDALFANGRTITRVTISNIADSNGFLVSDGTQVAVTATPAFQQTSAGGTIVGGTPNTADPRFKIFTTANGRVRFDYQSPALVLAPGFSASGIIQVANVTSTGIPISMIANSPVTLVTSQTATISVNPQTLLPNGTSQAEISIVVRDPINTLDDFGRPIPAGTVIGAGVLSAQGPLGTINGGTVAPDSRYKLFNANTGGLIDFFYTAPNLVQTPGDQTLETFSAVSVDPAGNFLGTFGFNSLLLSTGGCVGNECVSGGFTGPLPKLVALSPGPGEDNVGTTAPIMTQFSQSIDLASVTSTTFAVSSGGIPIVGTYVLSAGPSGPNSIVTFTPTTPWTAGTAIDVALTTGIKNLAGNPLLTSAFNSFSIGAGPDSTGPSVVRASLGNGLTNVPHSAVMNVQFTQPIDAVTLNNTNFVVSANGTPITGRISLSNGEFGINTIATFIQDQLLASDTLYTISVGSGVTDSSGNALTPAFTSTFRTATSTPITDMGQPSVDSVTPSDGQLDVPLNPAVVVQMDKPINPITINPGSFGVSTFSQGPVEGSIAVAPDQSNWTFTPTTSLLADTQYSIDVTNGLRDIAGNRLSVSGTTAVFNTGTALSNPAGPQVDSVTPANNATNVFLNQPITIRFSEPLATATVTNQTVFVRRGGTAMAGVLTLMENNRAIRWVPANAGTLSPNALYTITITTGVTGLSANHLAAQITFSFTTGTATDTAAPAVTSFSPLTGAQNVPRNAQIQVIFNEPIDPASAVAGFSLEHADSGTPIAGALTLAPDRTTIQFVPSFPLFAGQTFNISLFGITDSVGNQMAFTGSTFVTAVAPGTNTSLVPDSASVTSSQTTLTADGLEIATITISGVSQGGVPVADGTVIGVTTAPAYQTDSFPGTLVGGTTSGADTRFNLYTVVDGTVTLTYQTPALPSGSNRNSYVQVVGVDALGAPMNLIGERRLRLFGTGVGQ